MNNLYRINESKMTPAAACRLGDLGLQGDEVLVPVEPCEYGNVKEHLVDYWWQNTSDAGAEWCDGVPNGKRIENLCDTRFAWRPEFQGLAKWTGHDGIHGKWLPVSPPKVHNDELGVLLAAQTELDVLH